LRFQEPNLFGRLTNRLYVDNLVIDQEIVTRTFPEGPGEVDVIAIYEINAGKIAKAWFKSGQPRLASSLCTETAMRSIATCQSITGRPVVQHTRG
jgi:hypothetical protein